VELLTQTASLCMSLHLFSVFLKCDLIKVNFCAIRVIAHRFPRFNCGNKSARIMSPTFVFYYYFRGRISSSFCPRNYLLSNLIMRLRICFYHSYCPANIFWQLVTNVLRYLTLFLIILYIINIIIIRLVNSLESHAVFVSLIFCNSLSQNVFESCCILASGSLESRNGLISL